MPKKAEIQFLYPRLTLLVKDIMDVFVDDNTIWQNLLPGLDSASQGTIQEIATRLKLLHNGGNNYCIHGG
jgi:hypothetical protein